MLDLRSHGPPIGLAPARIGTHLLASVLPSQKEAYEGFLERLRKDGVARGDFHRHNGVASGRFYHVAAVAPGGGSTERCVFTGDGRCDLVAGPSLRSGPGDAGHLEVHVDPDTYEIIVAEGVFTSGVQQEMSSQGLFPGQGLTVFDLTAPDHHRDLAWLIAGHMRKALVRVGWKRDGWPRWRRVRFREQSQGLSVLTVEPWM